MAIKPTETVPVWASNTNWSAGPSAGLANKIDPTAASPNGHIEGVSNPTDSRVQNGWQNRVSKWSVWVESGSSTGAADAHIVETNANGEASVTALNVLGGAGIAGPSLQVTRGAGGTEAVSVSTPGVSNILFGGDSFGVQMTVEGDGVAIGVTGSDRVPLTLYPQYTRPTTFTNQDGSIGFESVSIGGADPTQMYAIVNNAKRGVPLYNQQWVYQLGDTPGTATFNGEVGAATTIISAFDFDQAKAPLDAAVSMLYEITFEASSTGGLDFWVRIRNNGTAIRDFYIDGGGTATIKQVSLRGIYLAALATTGNSFDVVGFKLTGQGGGNSITVDHMLVTIHTAL